MVAWAPIVALEDEAGKAFTARTPRAVLKAVPRVAKMQLHYNPGSAYSGVHTPYRTATGFAFAVDPPLSSLQRLLDIDIPLFITDVTDDERSMYCVQRNKWLLVGEDCQAAFWQYLLADKYEKDLFTVADCTDSLIAIDMRGEDIDMLLSYECKRDLCFDAFPLGQYMSTHLFQFSIILHRLREGGGFRVYIDRSEALHLWKKLAKNIKELARE